MGARGVWVQDRVCRLELSERDRHFLLSCDIEQTYVLYRGERTR